MIRIILAVLFTVGAMQSYDVGMSYINEGHGLHPLIAFGAMFINLLGIAALLVYAWFVNKHPDVIEAYKKATQAIQAISSGYHG